MNHIRKTFQQGEPDRAVTNSEQIWVLAEQVQRLLQMVNEPVSQAGFLVLVIYICPVRLLLGQQGYLQVVLHGVRLYGGIERQQKARPVIRLAGGGP